MSLARYWRAVSVVAGSGRVDRGGEPGWRR